MELHKQQKYSLMLSALCGCLGIWLFIPAFTYLLSRWDKEDFNYCYLIPVVVLYLIWQKRSEFLSMPSCPSWQGIVPLGAGIILFWLGELGGEYFTLYLSCWALTVGLLLLYCGRRKLKTIAFPLFFSLAMFPPPAVVFDNVSLRLKLISSQVGVKMLQLMGYSAFREGNVIDLGFTQLQVVDACSGLRYLIPLLALGILIASQHRTTWWKRGILIVSTVPLTVITNSLRIASVGMLFPMFGPAVAEGFFHDFSGWLIFMVSLALLLGEVWLLDKVFKIRNQKPEARSQNSNGKSEACDVSCDSSGAAPALAAFVLLLVTVGVSQSVDFREKVPLSRPLREFPVAIGDWQGTRSSMGEEYLNVLHLTDYLLADYRNSKGNTINLYVAYNSSQRKGESSHSPGTCLPGSGWVFQDSGNARLQTGNGPPITVNRAYMLKNDERQLMFYWFPQRGRILTDMVQLKLYAFWDALTRQRTDGALVRLITPMARNESLEAAEQRLQGFARQATPMLDTFLPK